jgi:protein-S-isoprenylcysteine O-methyltransferase Ste14
MVTIIAPWFIYSYSPGIIPGFISIKIFAMAVFTAGILLFGWTIYLFQIIANGTLAPWTEKQRLVVTGPYAYCRNPMISGVLFMLIGEGLWLRSVPILTWAAIFFVINTLFFIFREEPFLENKFGEEYKAYKRKVPRWIPKLNTRPSA